MLVSIWQASSFDRLDRKQLSVQESHFPGETLGTTLNYARSKTFIQQESYTIHKRIKQESSAAVR